ncbi:hypothetical protein [Vibrio crassostreae]|uniref:hypothetical protein n=1 Tax=Vibrio crassostreae TaxID=246167 RepID=UPI001B30B0DA|nr:hypothetical protein [Vibrio crassostreae]
MTTESKFVMNHHPRQIGIWFPYDGSRYKDVYHLTLNTGEVLRCMYPNANSWFPESGSNAKGVVKDAEVKKVMLAPDHEVPSHRFKGEERIKLNCELFYEWLPEYTEAA